MYEPEKIYCEKFTTLEILNEWRDEQMKSNKVITHGIYKKRGKIIFYFEIIHVG